MGDLIRPIDRASPVDGIQQENFKVSVTESREEVTPDSDDDDEDTAVDTVSEDDFELVYKSLDPDNQIPIVDFSAPNQVYAWGQIRRIVQDLGTRLRFRVNIYVGKKERIPIFWYLQILRIFCLLLCKRSYCCYNGSAGVDCYFFYAKYHRSIYVCASATILYSFCYSFFGFMWIYF